MGIKPVTLVVLDSIQGVGLRIICFLSRNYFYRDVVLSRLSFSFEDKNYTYYKKIIHT